MDTRIAIFLSSKSLKNTKRQGIEIRKTTLRKTLAQHSIWNMAMSNIHNTENFNSCLCEVKLCTVEYHRKRKLFAQFYALQVMSGPFQYKTDCMYLIPRTAEQLIGETSPNSNSSPILLFAQQIDFTLSRLTYVIPRTTDWQYLETIGELDSANMSHPHT